MTADLPAAVWRAVAVLLTWVLVVAAALALASLSVIIVR